MVLGRVISPGEALTDYLNDHGLRRLSGRLAKAGVIDVVATAAPGLDDILVLGKVKQLERAGEHDLIVLDAPAAGHAVTFLRSARGLADAVTVGPIATQAATCWSCSSDPARCQVVLVTLPEETPVNEVVETAFALEERVGVQLAPGRGQRPVPGSAGPGLRPWPTTAAAPAASDDGAAPGRAASAWPARRSRTSRSARLSALLPLPATPPAVPLHGRARRSSDVEALADRLLDQLGALAA